MPVSIPGHCRGNVTQKDRLTFNDTFDGFPMFSPDGKKLVFASNRRDRVEGETNIWIADWIDTPDAKR
jgi:Tol biopolymer transport system component